MTPETCRGVKFYVIYVRIVYQVGTNKGILLSLLLVIRLLSQHINKQKNKFMN